jgi:hypothetical protein
MIDVERSQPAPTSLAEEKGWRGEDVLKRLFDDFLGKCYLCENTVDGSGSFEVDHRRQRGDGGADFDWANLFLICEHCNGRRAKSWPDGGLLDPAGGHRVEARVLQTIEYDGDDKLVPVFCAAAANDLEAVNTAAELERIHNDRDRGRLKAADLRDSIRKRVEKVNREVLEYFRTRLETPLDQQRIHQHEWHIRRLVARTAPFTMLVRSAIRRYVPPELFD